MRFIRRLKRSTKQYIIVAMICIVVIGSAAITTSIIMIGQIQEEYEYMLNEARQEMDENKKSVFVAVSNINTGEILSEDMVEERLVYTSQPIESYITKDELGKAVIIDIPEGTHIIKEMVAQNSVPSILREVEYDVIHVSSNIGASDYVDIRIFYPNGESFVVLSKKQLKGFQADMSICYLWVDEEELLRMSAAIVDAGLYQGSRLFMTKYIEPNIQKASVITYTPNISILSLIEHDPNIIDRCSQLLNKEVRKALENRLAESMDMNVKDIHWDIDGVTRYMPDLVTEHTSDNSHIDKNEGDTRDNELTEIDAGDNELADIEPKNKEAADIKTRNNKADNRYEFNSEDKIDEIINHPELGQLYDAEYFLATEG